MTFKRTTPITALDLDSSDLPYGDLSREAQEQKRALALGRWWVSLAGRATAPADIATITDSIFEGHNLTSYLNRIPYLVQQRLRTTFPTTGVTGGLGYIAPYMATGQAADWPVVNTGGTGSASVGLGARARLLTGSGHKCVFTFSGATHIGVRYYRSGTSGAAGTFTVQVDAGSTTTIDAKVSTTTDFIEYQVAIPDTGSHTVTAQWASGAVFIDGFMHYNGDTAAGIRMWEDGRGDADLATFMGNANQITYLGNQMAQIQPSLVVVELGANDYTGATPISAATFVARLATLISTIRSNVTTAPSIVLVCTWELADSAAPFAVSRWADFRSAIYAAAATDDAICVWDAGLRVRKTTGNSAASLGLLSSAESPDAVHPSNAGAFVLAESFARFISPG